MDWTISTSSTEEELEDPNIFVKRKGLFGSGLDAFLVALHRCPGSIDVRTVSSAVHLQLESERPGEAPGRQTTNRKGLNP